MNINGYDISPYTNLCYADLYRVDLYRSDLCNTKLCNANLRGANLCSADLRGADLRDATLCGANLYNADLRASNLHGAGLNGANLYNAKLSEKSKSRKGEKLSSPIVGWKKCKNGVLVKLEIPRGAIVFSINGDKCRTDRAKVLEIIGADRAISQYKYMSYYVGDEFNVYNFNTEYNEECAEGIHFFKTKEEAENY